MTTIRALYVDDEPDLLEITRLFLEAQGGLTVDTCASPIEAKDRLATTRYDVVISDYQMPEMDGIAFLKYVRSHYGSLPFILFTGRGREEVVIQALENGADFYLQKGGDPKAQFAELRNRIDKAVGEHQAVTARRDTERQLSDIINFLPDATFAIDRGGRVISWNKAIEEMTGIPAGQMLGRGDYEYAIPFYGERRPILIDLIFAPHEEIQERYSHIVQDGTMLAAETSLPRPQGTPRVLWGKASPLYGDDGQIIGAIEAIRDITDRKKTEEALRDSEAKFREMADMMPQIIFETDSAGILTYANAVAFEMFGYSREDFPHGLNVIDMVAPEDRKSAGSALSEIVAGRLSPAAGREYRALRKDGTTFPVTIYTTPIRSGGRVTGTRGIIVDISARKKVEETLHERERFLTTLISNLPGFAYRCRNDRDWTMIYISEGCRELTGYAPEEFLDSRPLTYNDLIHPDHRERIWREWQEVLAKKEVFEDEYPILAKSGETRWVWERGRGVFSDDGALQFLEGFITDITARKRTENLLRAQYDLGKVLSAMHGFSGTLEACLDTAIRVSDLDAGGIYIVDEASGDLDLAAHRGLSAAFTASVAHYPSGSPHGRLVMKGDPFYTRFLDAGVPVDAVQRDEGIRAIAIIPVLHEGRVIACLNIASHTLEEIPESSRHTLETIAAQMGTAIANARVDELARRNRLNLEATFASIDDFIFVVDGEGRIVTFNPVVTQRLGYTAEELAGRPIAEIHAGEPEEMKPVVEDMLAGRCAVCPVQLLAKDGTRIPVETRVTRGTWDSRPVLIGISRDVAERRRAEDALRQANLKLNLLNSVSRHDMTNQLMVLRGFFTLSKKTLADRAATAEFIAKEERIAEILERQIAFTRYYQDMGVKEPAWQSVQENVEKATAALSLGRVQLEVPRTDPVVLADPLFEKVFYNLVDNALRYGGDRLTAIRIAAQETERGLVIIVEDDGAGISEEERVHLFERGYGKNTGFGLFLVREILGITGITIRETSEPGHGARFEMLVPKGMYRIGGKRTLPGRDDRSG